MQTKVIFSLISFSFLYGSIYQVNNSAIENNFKIKSFNYKINAQKYKIKQSKDYFIPSISFNATASKDKYHYDYPDRTIKYNSFITSYSFQLSQTVFNRKIFKLIKEDKLKLKYISLQKEDQKQKINTSLLILKRLSLNMLMKRTKINVMLYTMHV